MRRTPSEFRSQVLGKSYVKLENDSWGFRPRILGRANLRIAKGLRQKTGCRRKFDCRVRKTRKSTDFVPEVQSRRAFAACALDRMKIAHVATVLFWRQKLARKLRRSLGFAGGRFKKTSPRSR